MELFGTRKGHRNRICLTLALLVTIGVIETSCTRQQEFLYARDSLARAGDEVRLSARFMRTGLLVMNEPGVSGEVVRIHANGACAGEGLTDVRGVFSCRIPGRAAGSFLFDAGLPSSRWSLVPNSTGFVEVLARDRPLILVEIDTLFEAPKKPLLDLPFLDRLRSPELQFFWAKAPPHLAPGADAALERLAQHYSIAYLALLGEVKTYTIRRWIEEMDCPVAPVLAWEVRPGSDEAKAIEGRRDRGLRRLTREIEGPIVGIAGSDEAARQYCEQGLLAVYLDLRGEESGEDEIEEGPDRMTRWKETGALLSGGPYRDPAHLRRNDCVEE